ALAASVPIAFAAGLPPRWTAILLLALCAGLAFFGRGAAPSPANRKSEIRNPRFDLALLFLAAAGVLLYGLRALTEPMWSNDFVAIWGLKGKMIFAAGEVPRRLFTDPALEFSHPEYPLGLPFLYAAMAFLLGRWEDHATALVFPALQIATLLVLYGCLPPRSRPSSSSAAGGAAAGREGRWRWPRPPSSPSSSPSTRHSKPASRRFRSRSRSCSSALRSPIRWRGRTPWRFAASRSPRCWPFHSRTRASSSRPRASWSGSSAGEGPAPRGGAAPPAGGPPPPPAPAA